MGSESACKGPTGTDVASAYAYTSPSGDTWPCRAGTQRLAPAAYAGPPNPRSVGVLAVSTEFSWGDVHLVPPAGSTVTVPPGATRRRRPKVVGGRTGRSRPGTRPGGGMEAWGPESVPPAASWASRRPSVFSGRRQRRHEPGPSRPQWPASRAKAGRQSSWSNLLVALLPAQDALRNAGGLRGYGRWEGCPKPWGRRHGQVEPRCRQHRHVGTSSAGAGPATRRPVGIREACRRTRQTPCPLTSYRMGSSSPRGRATSHTTGCLTICPLEAVGRAAKAPFAESNGAVTGP